MFSQHKDTFHFTVLTQDFTAPAQVVPVGLFSKLHDKRRVSTGVHFGKNVKICVCVLCTK